MKPSNQVNRSKVPSTSSTSSDQTSSSKPKTKCPTPRYSSFKIDSVLSPFSNLPASSPFKFLRFDSTSSPRHRRQSRVLINDIEKNFGLDENEISDSDNESDDETVLDLAKKFKSSIFESTGDRKSSNWQSLLKKEESGLDCSGFQDMNTKADENFTTLVTNVQEGRDTPLGILPKKMFCERCKMETTSVVNVKLPTLPFWRVLCCMNSVTDPCFDIENLDQFQEFQHKCRICKTTIATGHPL